MKKKLQITNYKSQINHNIQNIKTYDLEERTFTFANAINQFVKNLNKTIPNIEIIKQLVRSANSIGANYIEANEALSKKDFSMRIKICRKEAKETIYWLKLVEAEDNDKKQKLIDEAIQLKKIFSSIAEKTKC